MLLLVVVPTLARPARVKLAEQARILKASYLLSNVVLSVIVFTALFTAYIYLADTLEQISRARLVGAMTRRFGESDAGGAWNMRDAFNTHAGAAAPRLGQPRYALRDQGLSGRPTRSAAVAGCFTEIIAHRTRLFVPPARVTDILESNARGDDDRPKLESGAFPHRAKGEGGRVDEQRRLKTEMRNGNPAPPAALFIASFIRDLAALRCPARVALAVSGPEQATYEMHDQDGNLLCLLPGTTSPEMVAIAYTPTPCHAASLRAKSRLGQSFDI